MIVFRYCGRLVPPQRIRLWGGEVEMVGFGQRGDLEADGVGLLGRTLDGGNDRLLIERCGERYNGWRTILVGSGCLLIAAAILICSSRLSWLIHRL